MFRSSEIAETLQQPLYIYMQFTVVSTDDFTCLLVGGTATALFFHVLNGNMVSHGTKA